MRTEAPAQGRAHPECSQKPKLSDAGTGVPRKQHESSLQDTLGREGTS